MKGLAAMCLLHSHSRCTPAGLTPSDVHVAVSRSTCAPQVQASGLFCRCQSTCCINPQLTSPCLVLTEALLLCRCKPCSSCCGHCHPAGSRRCSGLPGSRASSSASTQASSGAWCSVKGGLVAFWQPCRCLAQPFAQLTFHAWRPLCTAADTAFR